MHGGHTKFSCFLVLWNKFVDIDQDLLPADPEPKRNLSLFLAVFSSVLNRSPIIDWCFIQDTSKAQKRWSIGTNFADQKSERRWSRTTLWNFLEMWQQMSFVLPCGFGLDKTKAFDAFRLYKFQFGISERAQSWDNCFAWIKGGICDGLFYELVLLVPALGFDDFIHAMYSYDKCKPTVYGNKQTCTQRLIDKRKVLCDV